MNEIDKKRAIEDEEEELLCLEKSRWTRRLAAYNKKYPRVLNK